MKPIPANILEDLRQEIFTTRMADLPYFSTEFHFHKECQLVYIFESEGRRIIGDSVETFHSDELILVGSCLPHVWYNDKRYFEKAEDTAHARSLTLFFDSERLMEILGQFGPVKKLEAFLDMAKRGMKFHGETKEKVRALLIELDGQAGLQRLVVMLQILQLLASTREYELLASHGYINTYQIRDNDRIEKVFSFIINNFAREIQLDNIAEIAGMNKQAFCRYFKNRTQKTFTQFVNEIRVGHACKLIAEGENNIAGLAYDCGFNSLSNFNRFFKGDQRVVTQGIPKRADAIIPSSLSGSCCWPVFSMRLLKQSHSDA